MKNGSTPLGRRLRQQRALMGFTQRELARLSKINFTYICQVETGATADIRLGVCAALAKALHCDPAWLAGWK